MSGSLGTEPSYYDKENMSYAVGRTYEPKTRRKKRVALPKSILKQLRHEDSDKQTNVFSALFSDNIKKLKAQEKMKDNIDTHSNNKHQDGQIKSYKGMHNQRRTNAELNASSLEEKLFDEILKGPCYQQVSYKPTNLPPHSSISSDELDDTLFVAPQMGHKAKKGVKYAFKTHRYKRKLQQSFESRNQFKPKHLISTSDEDVSVCMKTMEISSQKNKKETSTPVVYRLGLPRCSEKLNISPILPNEDMCKESSSNSPVQKYVCAQPIHPYVPNCQCVRVKNHEELPQSSFSVLEQKPSEYKKNIYYNHSISSDRLVQNKKVCKHSSLPSPIQNQSPNKQQTSLEVADCSKTQTICTPKCNVTECKNHTITRNFMHDKLGWTKQCRLLRFNTSPDLFSSDEEVHIDSTLSSSVIEHRKHTVIDCCDSTNCNDAVNSKLSISEEPTNKSTSVIHILPVQLGFSSSECTSNRNIDDSNLSLIMLKEDNKQEQDELHPDKQTSYTQLPVLKSTQVYNVEGSHDTTINNLQHRIGLQNISSTSNVMVDHEDISLYSFKYNSCNKIMDDNSSSIIFLNNLECSDSTNGVKISAERDSEGNESRNENHDGINSKFMRTVRRNSVSVCETNLVNGNQHLMIPAEINSHCSFSESEIDRSDCPLALLANKLRCNRSKNDKALSTENVELDSPELKADKISKARENDYTMSNYNHKNSEFVMVLDDSNEGNIVKNNLSLQLPTEKTNSENKTFGSAVDNNEHSEISLENKSKLNEHENYMSLSPEADVMSLSPGIKPDRVEDVTCVTLPSLEMKAYIVEGTEYNSINVEFVSVENSNLSQTEGSCVNDSLCVQHPLSSVETKASENSGTVLSNNLKLQNNENSMMYSEVDDSALMSLKTKAEKTVSNTSTLVNSKNINTTFSTDILDNSLPLTNLCSTSYDSISKTSTSAVERPLNENNEMENDKTLNVEKLTSCTALLSSESACVDSIKIHNRHKSSYSSYSSQQSCKKPLRISGERGSCHGRCRISTTSASSWTHGRLSHQVVVSAQAVRASQGFRDVFVTRHTELFNVEDSISTASYAPNPAVELSDVELVLTARDVVLLRCNQTEPLEFAYSISDSILDNCKKIGEGVYGEVFSCEKSDGRCTVLKIIPIEGSAMVNGEAQKSFQEILSEIVIAMELSNLRHGTEFQTDGFAELESCWCVKGCYPSRLLELWHQFDTVKGSENDCPDMFLDDQLYIILELAHGGTDLEAYIFNSAEQSLSVFIQVAYTLAVAEGALEFEHRDLHWGNVLISPTTDKEVTYCLKGEDYTVLTKGVKVAIIDFTLSRMSYDECCIFNDLAQDPSLFQSVGDYQFDIYRHMQTRVQDQWEVFEPYTNVLWMHYVLGKMISGVHYRRTTTKVHKKFLQKLTELWESMLDNVSATAFVIVQDF